MQLVLPKKITTLSATRGAGLVQIAISLVEGVRSIERRFLGCGHVTGITEHSWNQLEPSEMPTIRKLLDARRLPNPGSNGDGRTKTPGTVITENATTMADTPDPNPANNIATVSITVQ